MVKLSELSRYPFKSGFSNERIFRLIYDLKIIKKGLSEKPLFIIGETSRYHLQNLIKNILIYKVPLPSSDETTKTNGVDSVDII